MNFMDERKEEDFDPTKDAFFSDLMGMEEEVATEAYELVEHAIHLVDTKYFDDGIEILRQAIGLYSQINRDDEIKAINEKISEVYLLKEQAFRESEGKAEKDAVELEEAKISEEVIASKIEPELIQETKEIDLYVRAEQLVNEGKELLNSNNFEETLNKYDRAAEILEEANNPEGVDRVFKLIEECYNKKAEFLRNVKKVAPAAEDQKELEQKELAGTESKEEKIQQYLISKKKEEEISSYAYEVLGKAADLAKTKQYDEALQLYKEGAKLFQDLNWTYEVKKVQDTIIQLENEKLAFLKKFEEQKVKKEEILQPQTDSVEILEQQAKDREEQEKLYRLERLKGIEFQKMENEFFKVQIDNMVTEASRMAREYELSMQKAIKKGEIIEECVYPKVIEVYEKIKELLIDKGWGSESAIYDDTIQVYQKKLKQDKKIRQIEAGKVRKQKEAEEYLKIKPEYVIPVQTESQPQASEELRKREYEEQKLRTEIEEITNRAERLAREYEVALRKGKFELKCPYPEIINIYRTTKQKSQERGWETNVAIFASQILAFTEKLEKDKRLRQIEAEKIQKQKEMDNSLKIKTEDKLTVSKDVKSSTTKVQTIEEEGEEDFEQLINDMVNRAEVMAREYDLAMKKAVRQGKLADNPPFAEVIKIYERVKQMALVKERNEEVAIYSKQINFYSQKWQKDKNLREVEASKAQRQKDIEEMNKVDRKVEIDEVKLKAIEIKRDEEEFERNITDNIDNAEKLVREYETEMRKAMRKGEVLEETPYSQVIDIYIEIREKVYARGWKEQAAVYANQVKIYQEKLDKHVILLEVEAKKADRQKEIEDMHKVSEDFKTAKSKKVKEIEVEIKEEDILLDNAMNLIDKAEKSVKNYELSIKTDVLFYESPYEEAIANYQEAKKLFQKIGWNEEASNLVSTIKFYKEKNEKDEKLRLLEKKKLEELTTKREVVKEDTEKALFAREKKILEFEKQKKEKNEAAEKIFNEIHKAERLAKEYELKIKESILDHEAPYDEILKIYREAKKRFEEIGWIEESMNIINTIKFYKEKNGKDKKLRALELGKDKKQEEELLQQQLFRKQAREAQQRVIKQRKESREEKEEKVIQFETAKNEAFALMDKAKTKLDLNNFEKAIEFYKKSEKIFSEISWQVGINMVIDSIAMIKRRQKSFEIEQVNVEKERFAKVKIEEELEETIAKSDEIRKQKQKEKRDELNRIQSQKQREREISDEAYKLLEQGTSLSDRKKFKEAFEKYIEARKLFEQISWKLEVSRINNDLLLKLKRAEQHDETLEEIKKKKIEEEEQMEKLKKETERERHEFKKQKKEDKRKQAREEFDKKIFRELERAEKFIDDFKYNEGILLLVREKKKLEKLSKDEDIIRIDELINEVKNKAEIPLVTLEPLSHIENLEKYETTYKALDKAQISLTNSQLKKAVSELNEAKFNLNFLKIGKMYIKNIDAKVRELQERLGKKHAKDDFESKEKEHIAEMDMLKARIAARREERSKKVLDLLKKD